MRFAGQIILAAFALACAWSYAYPHDAMRPDLGPWFSKLRSGKGLCCSGKDGTALSDVDWESKDGHYRVRLENEWWDVPDEAVITEPNLDGSTMVWPVYYRAVGSTLRIEIRCFMPGSMG